MVNKYKYSLVACVALTFGALWASDKPPFATPLLGLVGDELRIKAHNMVEIIYAEVFRDSPETDALLKKLDETKFTVDLGDQILHRKIAVLLDWFSNPDRTDAACSAAALATGYDVEAQGAFNPIEFRYWMLHKMLWDVTRPWYENFGKTELIKWALFPYVYSMACEEDERVKQRGMGLFSEFYFVRAILPDVQYYDVLIISTMRFLHELYERLYTIAKLLKPGKLYIDKGILIEVTLSAEGGPRVFVKSREAYNDEANPLPDWASVLVREGEIVTFSPGHAATFVPHGEGSGGAGGGSAGASCS